MTVVNPYWRARRRPKPTMALSRRARWISHTTYSFVGGWLGYLLVDERGMSGLWVFLPAIFAALLLSGDDPPWHRVPAWVLVAIATTTAFFLGASVAGVTDPLLPWTIAANLLAAYAGYGLYRFRGMGGALVPRDHVESLWLMLCAFVSVAVGVALGAFPGTAPLWQGGSVPDALAALCRYVVPFVVGALCLLPLFAVDDEHLLRGASRWWLVLFVPTAVVCAFAPTMIEGLPLSWLYAVPAVWAGLTMTRRWAGVALVAFGVAGTFSPYARTSPPPLGGILYPWSLVDLTFAFLIYLGFLLVTFREDSARLKRGIDRLADAASARRQLLRSILTPMSDALLIVEEGGRIRRANAAATRLLQGAQSAEPFAPRGGATATATIEDERDGPKDDPATAPTPEAFPALPGGASLDDYRLMTLESQPLGPKDLARLVRPGRDVVRIDACVPGPAGERRVRVQSTDIRTLDERLTLLMLKDVTAGHERQRELESFAGTVAHDLKGPLTVLSGWLEVGIDDLRAGDPESVPVALRHAQRAVDGMRILIEDYLAYAVSRGGVLHLKDVSLYDIVMDIVRVYTGLEGSGPTFEVDTPHVLVADPSLTRQLMANLIGNGMKYTREGEEPHIRVRSVDDAPGWAEVQVADHGRGLSPGAEERIFRRLDRGPGDLGGIQGVGLGLSLCQAIVSRHGGHIRAENNEWGGATFRFTMPSAVEPGVPA